MDKEKAAEKIEQEFIEILAAMFGISNDEEAKSILKDAVFNRD